MGSLIVPLSNVSPIGLFLTSAIAFSITFRLSSSFCGSRRTPPVTNFTLRMMSSTGVRTTSLQNLAFDNRNLRSLPVDTSLSSKSRQVPNAIFSLINPTPVKNPVLVAASQEALSLLGLDSMPSEEELADYLSGNRALPGSQTSAHCYCGHQFGSFAGQLGDGAAISLGEIVNTFSNPPNRYELQLKGAGLTPYSRSADGRKVLRSSIREFLCSEAMYHLNVPTTRAAACVTSDSTVDRDPYYDGHVIHERCTIVSRIAENFFRFGSFEIFKKKKHDDDTYARQGPSAGNEELKKQLLDYLIINYFPEFASSPDKYRLYFEEIIRRTAKLAAHWQSNGFVHGVLNTDNMSVMGVTIDYGPYGFMEMFDEDFVPNGSDHSGRYAYKEQPQICRWNLMKFAEALSPILPSNDAEQALKQYDEIYRHHYVTMMRAKLGIQASGSIQEDEEFIMNFFEIMSLTFADFADSFVAISNFLSRCATHEDSNLFSMEKDVLIDRLVHRSASPKNIVESMRRKIKIHRLSMPPQQIEQLYSIMQQDPQRLSMIFDGADMEDIVNEIESQKRTLSILIKASTLIKKYGQQICANEKISIDRALWTQWVEKYVNRLENDVASSCNDKTNFFEEKARHAHAVNPTLILRNWMAQEAINFADNNDFTYVRTLLKMLQNPFDSRYNSFVNNDEQMLCPLSGEASLEAITQCKTDLTEQERTFVKLPPEWADSLVCTCSS